MKITEHKITIGELANGYADNAEAGVKAFGGLLDVRPPYQREFVYSDKERDAVIDTVTHGYPLNVMYWSDKEGKYEIIDGQQRTISICQYVHGDFAFMFRYFDNLTEEEQQQILNYELSVYFCEGTDAEKLKWFETINIAGKVLTHQELLNAIYASPWLNDAKRHFSKSNCPAVGLGGKYLSGSPIRQDYLETVLTWVSERDRCGLQDYMAKHSIEDQDAGALWLYFQNVMNWVQVNFTYRKEMKGLNWGAIYNRYKDTHLNIADTEAEVKRLMADSDVENKKGIYWYIFEQDEHHLGIRAFDANTKREVYERQEGICPICGGHFEIEEMEGDHITPWKDGGRTIAANCQMLCRECNRRKGSK